MPEIPWSQAVEIIEPHIVRISTPGGSGTGFLVSNAKNSKLCSIATAAHVVEHADKWEEPIRIDHVNSGKFLVVHHDERVVYLDTKKDTAGILFNRGDLPLPPVPLELAPKEKYLKVGTNIGWLGFPAIPAANLCFFAGNVSAWIQEQLAYLVDGVAINGVSGGPAFHLMTNKDNLQVIVIGVVSAYVPNRATGEPLPGLAVVRDVTQFHELAPKFASLDQAKERAAEAAAESPAPVPENEGTADTPPRRST